MDMDKAEDQQQEDDENVNLLARNTSSLNIGESNVSAKDVNGQSARKRGKDVENEDKMSEGDSQSSRSLASSATARGATKVYYHIDDEQTPYCTEVPILPDRITLADFKKVLNRTNFKFYCKAIDPEVGGEVKAEIRDESQQLCRSSNGQFELFLLTAEGSSHSGSTSSVGLSKLANLKRMVPGPAPLYPFASSQHLYRPQRNQFDSLHFKPGHRRKAFEDSTVYTTEETDGRVYSDDESRLSTSTDNITSVSRQHYNFYRRRRRQFHRQRRPQQPSRASSLSSMTETSMALEVITVTLNMDTVNFLGISIVGQSSSRGDNGIYVANVMPGGAVALDGRIEAGDMILQVNDISFENFKNDQAVEVLKQAVNRKGPIKLTVAKSFDAGRANYFSIPSREPVRPIDTHAWVQHTNAVRGVAANALVNTMNAIPEESAPTPVPGQYTPSLMPPLSSQQHHQMPPSAGGTFSNAPSGGGSSQHQQQQQQQRPASSSTTTGTSNGSGAGPSQTIVGPGGMFLSVPARLDLHTDRRKVVHTMAMPNSGLDIRDRTWLKIPIPMSFLGSALVDWLLENVEGLRDRKEARKYASELLRERLIAHVVNKQQFTEQCYYIFGELNSENGAAGLALMHQHRPQQQQQHIEMMGPHGPMAAAMFQHRQTTQMAAPPYIHQQQTTNFGGTGPACSEYASMPPVSPYPVANIQQQQTTAFVPMDYHQHQQRPAAYGSAAALGQQQLGTTSQTSNNSNEESSGSEQRRKALLPPAPSLNPSTAATDCQQFMAHQYGGVGGQQPHQQMFSPPRQQPLMAGAPPTTPIADEAIVDAARQGGGQTAGHLALNNFARIRGGGGGRQMLDHFPEMFVEHF